MESLFSESSNLMKTRDIMSTSSKPSEHPKGSWEDTIIEDSSDLEDSWADDVMFDGSHSSGKAQRRRARKFKKVRAKKLVKSNKANFVFVKLHFWQF